MITYWVVDEDEMSIRLFGETYRRDVDCLGIVKCTRSDFKDTHDFNLNMCYNLYEDKTTGELIVYNNGWYRLFYYNERLNCDDCTFELVDEF